MATIYFYESLSSGSFLPSASKRGRSETTQKLLTQEKKRAQNSPVSKTDADKMLRKNLKEIFGDKSDICTPLPLAN